MTGAIKVRPLTLFFIIAFAGAWLVVLPEVLGANGLQVLGFSAPVAIFVLLGAIAGPALGAILVTRIEGGPPAVKELLKACLRWRVSPLWYAVVLLLFPALSLIAAFLTPGLDPIGALAERGSLLVTFYLPNVLIFVVVAAVFEEIGWRGFALPRLQSEFGPLWGGLILGALWAVWHLPAYLVNGWMGPVTMLLYVQNTLAIIALSLLFSWIANGTGGSVLIATLFHAASNASSATMAQLMPDFLAASQAFLGLMIAAVLIVIILTRGRLGERPAAPSSGQGDPAPA